MNIAKEKQITKINQLEEDDEKKIIEIQNLTIENKSQVTKINQLKQENEKKGNEIQNLKQEKEKQVTKIKQLKQEKGNEIQNLKQENEKKGNEIQKLKKEKENEKKQFDKEKNLMLQEKEDIIKNLTKNEADYKKLKNLLDEIKENNINDGLLAEKYLSIKNENDKLKNEMKLIDKRTNETDIIKLNKELNIELEKCKNKCLEYEKTIEEIKRLKNEKLEKYKKNDYNEDYIDKQLEEFYDVVINIKSIASLTKPEGWPIKWNPKRKEIIENIKKDKLLKVGVLGNGNVGKSFLLSRLFNINIPSGYSVITEGLNLKFNENEFYTILDSAGLQTPLIKEEKEEKEENQLKDVKNENDEKKNELKRKRYENLYKDKTQTENFIQNLIIYESDMLLIVVGKLTFNEQRLINKIKKEIELGLNDNNKKKKPIYIIHNLMNFQTKKQVKEHINDTLLKSASFNIKTLPYVKIKNQHNPNNENNDNDNKREMLVENDDENEVQTYHLIMAREETEAGDYYNNFTYKFLQEQFNYFTKREPLSIIEEIKKKFVEWSNDLLEESINEDNIQIEKDENDKEIKYIFKESDNKNEKENKNENENHNKESENKNEIHKIIPKACISDELGLSIYRSNGYDPPYYFHIENDEKFVVILEIPGDNKIDEIYADTDQKEIIVKGNKSNGNDSIKKLYNNTKFGKFNLHIPYGNKIQIADELPIENEDSYKDGIYTYKFKLIKKRKHANRK